jgi:hypothetical protein
MKINRNNYESYFIDYLEGNLDEKLVNDFIEFLQLNPDLKDELSLFDSASLEPELVAFSKKEKLYKDIFDSELEFNRAAIAQLEGDISKMENTDFEIYLAKHPEKQKEALLFRKTKLIPDKTIVFTPKKILYKREKGKTILLWSIRIAAVLVLAMVFYFLTNQPSEISNQNNQIALSVDENSNKKIIPEVNEAEQVPVKKAEKEEEKPAVDKEKTKPEIKKPVTKPKTTKSLRETTKGRMGGDDLALERIPLEVPAELKGITASLQLSQPVATLATMNPNFTDIQNTFYDERLLADVVKEKAHLDKISFSKIKKAGLNLVSNFTKDNFTYETNENGKVTEYNYDSRLFAFSIPASPDQDGE